MDDEITEMRKGISKFEGREREKSLRFKTTYKLTTCACLPLRKHSKEIRLNEPWKTHSETSCLGTQYST